MPDRDALLQERARGFYERATPQQQRALDEIITQLCADPEIDNQSKFAFGVGMPDFDGRIFLDDEFRIVYRMLNPLTLSIEIIGSEREPPPLRASR